MDEEPRPGWATMAIDTALLERADRRGEAWLRLYQWKPYCLSFGRHEPATRRYDVERIEALCLDTVRRPTGGRAVWHARELTYAVAAPWVCFGSLKAAYLEIHRMIADGLGWLGARVSLAPPGRTAPLDAGACFAQPAGGEVMLGGRKIVGSAQYRQGSALLQHGSVLLEDDQQMVLEVTRGTVDPAPLAPLADLSGFPLQSQDVARSIAQAAALRWAGEWIPTSSADQVMEDAFSYYPHYRSAAWTWVR
jgi:lipoate-protein ligase A